MRSWEILRLERRHAALKKSQRPNFQIRSLSRREGRLRMRSRGGRDGVDVREPSQQVLPQAFGVDRLDPRQAARRLRFERARMTKHGRHAAQVIDVESLPGADVRARY